MIDEASWGQHKLRPSDVDFITIDTGATKPVFNLRQNIDLVQADKTYNKKFKTLPYTRTLIFLPPDQPACTENCPIGSASIGGDFSNYRSNGQYWQVIAHELGHNDGLQQ